MHAARDTMLAVLALLLSTGCQLPHDPLGTYLRVQKGTLRVGITENTPFTHLDAQKQPGGVEVELLHQCAQQLDAQIEWIVDSESNLVELLHRGQLDLIIGGFARSTPWSEQVALTQPYVEWKGKQRVMAVRQGENRWLLELDRFLQGRQTQVFAWLQANEQEAAR